jgi:hypothetical protein
MELVTISEFDALIFTGELKWRIQKLIDNVVTITVKLKYAHGQGKIRLWSG